MPSRGSFTKTKSRIYRSATFDEGILECPENTAIVSRGPEDRRFKLRPEPVSLWELITKSYLNFVMSEQEHREGLNLY